MIGFDIGKVNPFHLPSVPLANRSHLYEYGGIYFVTLRDEVVLYIGESSSIRTRLSGHHVLKSISEQDMPYARVHWLPIDSSNKPLRLKVEAAFINKFCPPLNSEIPLLADGPGIGCSPDESMISESAAFFIEKCKNKRLGQFTRSQAVDALSFVRGYTVAIPTFYRWLKICNIEPKSFYSKEEVSILAGLAAFLKNGGKVEDYCQQVDPDSV